MEGPISFWGYKEQESNLILPEHDDDDDDDDDKPRAGRIHGKQGCTNGGKSIVCALPVQHDVSGLQFISLLFLHFHLAPD